MSEMTPLTDGLGYLEAPRWINGRLWFSDFYSRRVCSLGPSGRVVEEFYVSGQPSGLGVCPDGTLLVVSAHDGHVLRWNGERKIVLADVGANYRGALNDMVVDGLGRAYVSTLPVPVTGPHGAAGPQVAPIMLVDSDGSVSVAANGLRIANGMAITTDSQLIVAETLGARLLAYDIDADTGCLSGCRVFADLAERRPDGICLDADGHVWFGSYSTSEFVLVAEGGEVLHTIRTPGRWAVACALGGEDGHTLFGLAFDQTLDQYLNGTGTGSILACEVDRPAVLA